MESPRPTPPSLFQLREPAQIAALGLALVFLQQLLIGALEVLVADLNLRIGLSVLIALVALPAWLIRREGLSLRPTLELFVLPPSQAGWLVLMGLAMVLPVNTLGEWNSQFIEMPDEFAEMMLDFLPETPGEWVLSALVIGLLVPIGEEIVFRGVIQQAARHAVGSRGAILLIGLLFALLHLQPWVLLGLFGVGITLGAVYERSGTLLAPMVLHAVYNTSVLIIQTWSRDQAVAPEWLSGTRGAALSSLGLGLVLWSLSRLRRAPGTGPRETATSLSERWPDQD